MRILRIQTGLFSALLCLLSNAQQTWGIKDPGTNMADRCGACLEAINAKPKEVLFGVFEDEDRNIWFLINDPRYLEKLIRQGGLGFAVDIVSRDQYDCTSNSVQSERFPKGTMLEPIYQSELKVKAKIIPGSGVVIPMGKLPVALVDSKREFNLIILKNKYLCYYNTFTNLQSFRWDLLNMGMYMDTLTYSSRADTIKDQRLAGLLKRKALQFTIPFEKNKSEYSPQDLQPLYDSLRLTDFTIKRIEIQAYSSVEGTEERNMELQQKRAQIIVAALQSFQSPSMTTKVQASENWVEFLNDVSYTPYASIGALDKAEIKAKLADKRTAEALEPILSLHRKALIILELQRKDTLMTMQQEKIIEDFEKAIADKNLDYARKLQNTVFARIVDNELPSSFLERLEVPAQRDFATLLSSRAAFKYFEDPADAYQTFLALQDLERLLPTDGHIKYNLCAVQFQLLVIGEQAVDPFDLERSIKALRSYDIEEPLVTRMLINHNILMAELDMSKGDYAKKDTRMAFIRKNYKTVPMEQFDHLSLAQYFASYSNYKDARDVLAPSVTDIHVGEDLLFYYLNLTIFDTEQTKQSMYRKLMLNAINKNRQRFCDLFTPISEGGITFQLLDDPYLRKTYCETCN